VQKSHRKIGDLFDWLRGKQPAPVSPPVEPPKRITVIFIKTGQPMAALFSDYLAYLSTSIYYLLYFA